MENFLTFDTNGEIYFVGHVNAFYANSEYTMNIP